MQQLISITTDGQGSSVVSARELHAFLEVRTRFNDWIKSRIITYGFQEAIDFMETEGFTEISVKPLSGESEGVFLENEKNPAGGRPQTDYALTLDMAKQLSMVEKNAKGKEARRYFIDCERAALELAKQQTPSPAVIASPNEQLMLQLMQQQAQLMSNQQLMLEQLRADVEQIRQTGHRPPSRAKRLHAPVAPPHRQAPASLRQQIVRKVNEYCARYGVEHSDAYKYLYRRLSLDFGFNVHTYRLDDERPLDTIERYGKLVQLLSIIDSELTLTDE